MDENQPPISPHDVYADFGSRVVLIAVDARRDAAFTNSDRLLGPAFRHPPENVEIDRIACPWLILRFIDPAAEFIYVLRDQVLTVAQQTDVTPYDIDGVEFTHQGAEIERQDLGSEPYTGVGP
jgi:hypothetical protein